MLPAARASRASRTDFGRRNEPTWSAREGSFGLEQREGDPPLFMPPGQGGIHKRNTGPESTRAETQRITEGLKA